jgi:hypothetical protein
MKAITIKIDDQCELVESLWEYQEINNSVDGWIEGVSLGKYGYMFINEEGKLLGLDINKVATFLAKNSGNLMSDDYIAGNAVIFGQADDEGNSTDVPERTISLLKDMGFIENEY